MNQKSLKIAYGDFQTPSSLALDVCNVLAKDGVSPKTIIEPTCGIGNFIKAAEQVFNNVTDFYGYEINKEYVKEAQIRTRNSSNTYILCEDFFSIDWKEKFKEHNAPLLILGNLPWVTSSTQGSLFSTNLPQKNNFLNFKGLEAVTGKANFDISEWMLIALLEATRGIRTDIAVLVKTIVARKILSYIGKNSVQLSHASMYKFDAKKYFDASVSSCLFHIKLNYSDSVSNTCNSFEDLYSNAIASLYIVDGEITNKNDKSTKCQSVSPQKWRSGIKHDAAKVMELKRNVNGFVNGFGEIVEIEEDYLYPLLKGSDVANNRYSHKWVIVPQCYVGEETDIIRSIAPKTWSYLDSYSSVLDNRRSIIYKNNPRFSIFGIGDYAFKKWKIAICGLYKKLSFNVIEPIDDKPCMFDDTVYFISFDSKEEALKVHDMLSSQQASEFFNGFIFWDEKRPIKTTILNKFDWHMLLA